MSWPGASGGSWDCVRSAAVCTMQTCALQGNAQAEERVLHSREGFKALQEHGTQYSLTMPSAKCD